MQAVITVPGSGLVRKACFVQRGVQKVTRAITGEYTPGSISSVCRGCQPQNKKLRRGIAKPGYGASPVAPLAIRAPFLASHSLAVFDEPRALPAFAHLLCDDP